MIGNFASLAPDGPRVILIDHDENFRVAMSERLTNEGFEVLELPVEEISEILDIVGRIEIGAVLIDVEEDFRIGSGLIKDLRKQGFDVPVAFLADEFNNSMEEAALSEGAADCLAKSRGPTIVAERTRLLLCSYQKDDRIHPTSTEITRIGELTLMLESHRALWQRQRVSLTVTEFRIVRLLAMSPGTTQSYRKIYDIVRAPGFVAGDGPDGYRTNVRALIKKIRKRFRNVDAGFEEIENDPGEGYRWRPSRPAQMPEPIEHVQESRDDAARSPVIA